MKILSLSTLNVPCGIGNYNSDLMAAFERMGHTCKVERIERSIPPTRRNLHFLRSFAPCLADYDMAVIQHEFSFYGTSIRRSNNNFARLIRSLRHTEKPICLFMHTMFPRAPKQGWWRTRKYLRAMDAVVAAINENPKVRVFVHGTHSKSSFASDGVNVGQIVDIAFPMFPDCRVSPPKELKKGEPVTLLMFGFISAYKGYEAALNAMRLLPDNVRLVIAGERSYMASHDLTLDAIHGFLEIGEWYLRPRLRRVPRPFTATEREVFRERCEVIGICKFRQAWRGHEQCGYRACSVHTRWASSFFCAWSGPVFGRPIVASSIPGFVDVQQRANCLRLIPPLAYFELADAIRRLIDDHGERLRMSAAAKEFALGNHFGTIASTMISVHKMSASQLGNSSAAELSATRAN